MNRTASLLERIKSLPFGLWIFSRLLCIKAPYFSSIRPTFTHLEPGMGEAKIKKCRRVLNHIGTVHAIAMANLCELVAGTTLEISIPHTHRWIPKSMKINYINKANTSVRAKTKIDVTLLPDNGSFPVFVEVLDENNQTVVTADIEMHISRKK